MADKCEIESTNLKLKGVESEINKAQTRFNELIEKQNRTPEEENERSELKTTLKRLKEEKEKIIFETQTCLGEEREIKPNEPNFIEKMKKMAQELIEGKTLKLTPEIVSELFKSLDHIKNPEFKHRFLVAILTQLNQRGISVNGIEGGKIKLKTGRQNTQKNLDIANNGETVAYESLINNYLKAGKISIIDINTALLYRTSSLDTYLKEKAEGQTTSTSDYAERLFKKYNIGFKGPPLKDFKFSADPKEKETQYGELKGLIEQSITDNQADKEFLLVYFDDIYYNEKKGINENAIDEYKKIPEDIKSGFAKLNNLLDPDQKYSLGILSENQAEQLKTEWKNDPKRAFIDAFNKGGGLLGFIFAIIGSFIGGKAGAIAGFGAGFGIGGGGDIIAGELIERAGRNKGGESNTEDELKQKYKSLFEKDIGECDSVNLQKHFEDLNKNTHFLDSDSTKLNIFKDGTKYEDIEKYFKSIGVSINHNNKKYYETIFNELLKDREKSGIGEPVKEESMNKYLLKTNKTEEKKPDEKKPETTGEKVNIIEQIKKEINQKEYTLISNLFKDEPYCNLTITQIEEKIKSSSLEKLFKDSGDDKFYQKYKDSINKILQILVKEPNKQKTLKEIFN